MIVPYDTYSIYFSFLFNIVILLPKATRVNKYDSEGLVCLYGAGPAFLKRVGTSPAATPLPTTVIELAAAATTHPSLPKLCRP